MRPPFFGNAPKRFVKQELIILISGLKSHDSNREPDEFFIASIYQKRKPLMNVSHILGRKRNRLSRCNKRLSSNELTSDQRLRLVQRAAELEADLKKK